MKSILENSDLPKLASPAQRALANAGIKKLFDLTKMSEDEFANLHGIGPNAMEKIRQVFDEKGLSFVKKKTTK